MSHFFPHLIINYNKSNNYGRLEEDGVILDSSIRTQDPGEIADFSFSDDSVINKVRL